MHPDDEGVALKAAPAEQSKTYAITPEMEARLKRDFTYHAPKGDQPRRYETMRFYAREFARTIAMLTPPSREQSLALTAIDNAVMHANAAIARNE